VTKNPEIAKAALLVMRNRLRDSTVGITARRKWERIGNPTHRGPVTPHDFRPGFPTQQVRLPLGENARESVDRNAKYRGPKTPRDFHPGFPVRLPLSEKLRESADRPAILILSVIFTLLASRLDRI